MKMMMKIRKEKIVMSYGDSKVSFELKFEVEFEVEE